MGLFHCDDTYWYRANSRGKFGRTLPLSAFKITIDHTKIDSDLTDYPVFVKLSGGQYTPSAGGHFNALAADGITQLKFEVEYQNDTDYEYIIYVKIPSVSSTVDTFFYIITSETTDKSDYTAVWSNDYVAVWHLIDNNIGDATRDGDDDSTNYGSTFNDGGGIHFNCREFDGINDYFKSSGDIYDPPDLSGTDEITVQFLFKTSTTTTDIFAEYSTNYNGKNAFIIYQDATSGDIILSDCDSSNYNSVNSSNSGYNDGAWHLFSGTIDRSEAANDENEMYIDDGEGNDAPVSPNNVNLSGNLGDYLLYIGARNGGVTPYDGLMCEVRLSGVKRSDAWLKADQHNLLLNNLTTIEAVSL